MTQKPTALYPSWQVPPNVHAFTTLRDGGVSRAPYASFNLGDHVEDEPSAVKKTGVCWWNDSDCRNFRCF